MISHSDFYMNSKIKTTPHQGGLLLFFGSRINDYRKNRNNKCLVMNNKAKQKKQNRKKTLKAIVETKKCRIFAPH